jgi:predicted lipoprotein with Yx(FWY)xxD motif
MKKIKLLIGILSSMPLVLQTAFATPPDVTVMYKPGIGNYLVDANGRTLYWSKKDMPKTTKCIGACLEQWPPFYNEAILTADPEMTSSDFGTIIRPDGKKQTTFRGYPLYYFSMDKMRGDTNGHKFNSYWLAMQPGKFHLVERYITGYSITVGSID